MRTAILMLLGTLSLSGCLGHEPEDLDLWMRNAGQGLHGKVDPLPQIQPYQPYEYQSNALGSPFDQGRLQVARRKAQSNGPDSNRPREVLENYELGQLKLTGTLLINKQYFGLVQTPEGGIYRVRTGSFIGPNFGIVRKISENDVTLEETVEDVNGEWVQQESKLYLLQQEQGQKP